MVKVSEDGIAQTRRNSGLVVTSEVMLVEFLNRQFRNPDSCSGDFKSALAIELRGVRRTDASECCGHECQKVGFYDGCFVVGIREVAFGLSVKFTLLVERQRVGR